MDALLILPFVTWFMQHPEYLGLMLILLMFMQIGLVFFWINPIMKKLDSVISLINSHAEESREHVIDSSNRGKQTESIKDNIIEMKGIISGISINNREIK